jgi:hypothetical protein
MADEVLAGRCQALELVRTETMAGPGGRGRLHELVAAIPRARGDGEPPATAVGAGLPG